MDWVVLRGAESSLQAVADEYGAGSVFLPRLTLRERVTGRSRRRVTVVVPQYPGYGFTEAGGPVPYDDLSYRWGVRPLLAADGRPATVPDAQLAAARDTERETALGQPTERVMFQDHRVGDYVTASLGRSVEISGPVVSVEGPLLRIRPEGSALPVLVRRALVVR